MACAASKARYNHFMRIFLLLLLLILLSPSGAHASDTAQLRAAVTAADAGDYSRAIAMARRAGFPFVADALRGEAYAKDELGASFGDIADFLAAYPAFPNRRAIVTAAEGYLQPENPPRDLDKFYAESAPITLNGFRAYITFLRQQGDNATATRLIKERWVQGPLAAGDDMAFRRQYDSVLTTQDDIDRLDRLVWESESQAANRMLGLLNSDYRALANARLALQRGDADAPALLRRVPQHLQNDDGLLYARTKFRRERDDTAGAVALMMEAGQSAGAAPTGHAGGTIAQELWWTERHIIIRRLIRQQDFRTAYRLAAQHGLTAGGATAGDFAAAEFLAGWLALRFLNDAPRAQPHFQRLYENVTQPVSRARGAYWLGRTFEAQGNAEQARAWYTEAGQHAFFFYGQLALAKLGTSTLAFAPEQPMPPEVRARFQRQPLVNIIEAFSRVNDDERARRFLRALLPTLGTRAEFAYAAQLGRTIGPEMEVEAAKAANTRGFMLAGYGYPTVRLAERRVPESALTLGLIRQESQFQEDVESPAGARGLMQLLPSSARQIAKKYGEPYSGPQSLYNPALNVTLGRHYLADRIEQFNGSYIKAIAAYNAGQGRVRQWEEEIGDPQAGIDPIDWIELIPIYETRNYVQRVLEGTQVYRALLQGNASRGFSAPLRITQDLSR